jgi:hypothetical protein
MLSGHLTGASVVDVTSSVDGLGCEPTVWSFIFVGRSGNTDDLVAGGCSSVDVIRLGLETSTEIPH